MSCPIYLDYGERCYSREEESRCLHLKCKIEENEVRDESCSSVFMFECNLI